MVLNDQSTHRPICQATTTHECDCEQAHIDIRRDDQNRWIYDDFEAMADINESNVCSFSVDEEDLENADDFEVSMLNNDIHENIDDAWNQLQSSLQRDDSYYKDAVNIASSTYALKLQHYRIILNDWRKKICMWSFRVVDHWRYERHVVMIAMNLLDRYIFLNKKTLAKPTGGSESLLSLITEGEYQLAAMTCLYLAMKMNGDHRCCLYHGHNDCDQHCQHRSFTLRLSAFVELSRGQFDENDVCETERNVLRVLRWKVHPVIATDVGIMLLQRLWNRTGIATTVYHVIEELFSYISELTIIHMGSSSTFEWRPYATASASILLAMEFVTEQALPSHVRSTFRSLLYESATEAYNENRIGFEDYDDIPHMISRLQLTLQEALWPELLYLLEEETKYIHHPTNPLALGHALRVFDMEKVYRYHYHHQHMKSKTNANDGSLTSTTSASTSMPSSIKSKGNQSPCTTNRLSTFSPVATPNASFTIDMDDDESNTSPITTTHCFQPFARQFAATFDKSDY
jgi:Cyclin, N-terminal domain